MGALLIFTFSGCIKIKDELTIAADGSGQVRLETQLAQAGLQSLSQGLGMGMMGNSDNALYPPVDESEIQKFFPAKDFSVTVKPEKDTHGVVTLVTVAAFKDINALLASPYGRAHQLSVKITDGSLWCAASLAWKPPRVLPTPKIPSKCGWCRDWLTSGNRPTPCAMNSGSPCPTPFPRPMARRLATAPPGSPTNPVIPTTSILPGNSASWRRSNARPPA